MRVLRRTVQLAFLGLTVAVGLGAAMGWLQGASVEGYCPMGGLAALPSAITTQRFSCSTGEANFTALAGLLVLALLARKSFCAWLCPLGTLLEWLGRLGARLRGRRAASPAVGLLAPARAPDRLARWLRLGVLAAIVAATYTTSELVFRPYCPYYSLTSFHGHDVEAWSYAILGTVLLAALVLPMAWCRYLCPLGGALWPFARLGRLRVAREESACTGCGKCDRACPHGLRPSAADEVRSGECTLCLECRAACPERGALGVRAGALGARPRVSAWAVPGLLGGLAVLVVVASGLWSMPSYALDI
ncbi:MAG TPA: 4Fe-4S binding protein, partial [Myxococcota bacterium]|nr:4Fe-4S binding protein [Myxococcota bacterium]